MQMESTRPCWLSRALLVAAVIHGLASCGGGGGGSSRSADEVIRVSGVVDLRSSTGERYSFDGASAQIFGVEQAFHLVGKKPVPLGADTVANQGTVTIAVNASAVKNDQLYAVEFNCPADNVTDLCTVNTPMHIVLSGAQLKASGWTATVLTEMAYQRIAYYVTARYAVSEMKQILNNMAGWLLVQEADSTEKSYGNLLAWRPEATESGELAKRSGMLNEISEALAAGMHSNDVQLSAQQLVSAKLGRIDTEGSVNSIALSGDLAYLADGDYGLQIIDISDPYNPTNLGEMGSLGRVNFVTLAGDHAYVTAAVFDDQGQEGDRTVKVIDVGDLHNPHLVGELVTPGTAHSIAVSGDYAYIADGGGGLQIYNTHDPRVPVGGLVNSCYAVSITLIEPYAYLACGAGGFHIVDVSDPATPTYVSGIDVITLGHVDFLTVSGQYVYAVAGVAGLHIIDVSDPAKPVRVGQKQTQYNAKSVTVAGHYAYVSDSAGGIQIIDVINPSNPYLVGSLETGSPHFVALSGSYAYVANGGFGLQILDVSQSAGAVLAGSMNILEPVQSVVLSGNHAYLTLGWKGLRVVDVTDAAAPSPIAGLILPQQARSLFLHDSYAYVADREGHLQIANISNADHPTIVAGFDMQGVPVLSNAATSIGNYIYVADGHNGLKIIDITDPLRLELVGSLTVPGYAESVFVSGGYAYVAAGPAGLRIVDIQSPEAPELISTESATPTGWDHHAGSVSVSGHYVYVADSRSGLQIVNVSNPAQPHAMGRSMPGYAEAVALSGDYAYVAVGFSGLQIVNISNPEQPLLVGNASTIGYASSITVRNGMLYVATSYGLEILKSMPGNSTHP